jgi:predicted nucleotidyltransferase
MGRMRLPRFEIPDDRIATLCRRWQIVELSLFGSVLREDFDTESDVDVLVQFDPGVEWSLLDLMTMQSELSILVGRHVDLVEQAGLRNPFRRAAIIQSKHVVYAA